MLCVYFCIYSKSYKFVRAIEWKVSNNMYRKKIKQILITFIDNFFSQFI